jgi:hypothetical protein
MKNAISRLMGGSASWVMHAPNDDKGGAGDDDKTGADDKDGQGDADKGSQGDDADKDKGFKSKLGGGLFDKREGADKNKAADDDPGKQGEVDKGGADGRPAGVPEKFWNAKTKTVDNVGMAKAYTELEKAHGQLKRAKSGADDLPENPDGYFTEALQLPDTAKGYGKEVAADDPGLKAFAKVAHKYGVGKAVAANIARDMFAEMNEFAPVPIDPDQEMQALGKGGPQIIDGLYVWLLGAEESGKLSEDDADIANDLMRTAKGVAFLRSMRSISGEAPIPIIPGSGQRAMSAESWHEEMKEAVKTKNYKRQAELDEMSEAIFGDNPSHGGRPGGVSSEKVLVRGNDKR